MKPLIVKRELLCLGALLLLTPSCGDKNGDFDASGVFEATEVLVSAQGAGEIVALDVAEGETVEAGTLLGCIDTMQLHWQREQLKANKMAVDSRQCDVPKQLASLRQQLATQQRERTRYEKLVQSNAGNRKQLDDIDAQIALLEKQLAAQTETLENTNRSLRGESLALSAQIARVEDLIAKCRIESPLSGTVLAKYAEPGELAVQGRVLFKVADIGNLFLRVYVTADQLTRMTIGEPVAVFADDGTSDRREYAGQVVWISDKSEFTPKTIQTRNERANLVYAVKVAVKNDGYIKQGMYGEIKLNR